MHLEAVGASRMAPGGILHEQRDRRADAGRVARDVGAYMRYLFDDLRATGVFTDNPDLFPRR